MNAHNPFNLSSQQIEEDHIEFEDLEDEEDLDEEPSLSDLYGYDNDEDNEEAAYDDVLKQIEN